MIDLKIRPTGIALICSSCGDEWRVDETEPFVAQLRLVARRHLCARYPVMEQHDAGDERPTTVAISSTQADR